MKRGRRGQVAASRLEKFRKGHGYNPRSPGAYSRLQVRRRFRGAMMTCKRGVSTRALASPTGQSPAGRRIHRGYNAPRSQGRSSVGRAAVSKTVGRGFESLRPCSVVQAETALRAGHSRDLVAATFIRSRPLEGARRDADQADQLPQPAVVLRLLGQVRKPAWQHAVDQTEELPVRADPDRRLRDRERHQLRVAHKGRPTPAWQGPGTRQRRRRLQRKGLPDPSSRAPISRGHKDWKPFVSTARVPADPRLFTSSL